MANTKIPSELIADNSVGIDALNVTDGTNGQYLQTDGAGTLSFSTVSGYTDSDVATYLGGGNTINIDTQGTIKLDGNYPTGTGNVALGNAALDDSSLSGGNNTAIGSSALTANTTGTLNVALGRSAGDGITTGGFNTIIGAQSDTSSAAVSLANVIGYAVVGDGSYTTLGYSTSDIRAAHGVATWATVSDERYKKDITDSATGLSFINALRPRTFKYKNLGELPETFSAYKEGSTEVYKNSNTNHGFIAQEIKAAIDADDSIKDGFKLWDDREDGSQEVAEAALIPVLVKAIQELSAEVETLKSQLGV